MQTVTISRSTYQQLKQKVALYESGERVVVFSERVLPVVNLTPSERRRIHASRRTIAQGNYVTLNELKQDLERRGRASRKKIS